MADNSETNSLGGRVVRYARVGRAVGGLAARVAGERYLGLKIDRERHAGDLKAALGGLKGPLMKVAQILSTIPDVLPSEYAAELAELQSNAPPMGWPFVKRRMRSELGADWQSKFASFEHTAAAAASLGQVHRATDHDGTLLACKLQYPDMASVVEADLRQLRIAFGLYERYDKAISTQHIHQELSARLREELDYDREAKHIALYGAMLKNEAGVHVPEVRPALSTGRLLTMTWQEGTPLTKFADAPAEIRNALAYNMFRAWYVLHLWAEFVYAPLLENRTRKIQEEETGVVYGARVAEKVHGELRRLGGVTPPREFVLMDRAAIGLGSVFLRLHAEINWYELFHDLIGGFDVDALAKRQAAALKDAGVPAAD
jgi:predicted unusual protein kinase regulating ubiquinone biosynthesis (AarF/ABC1/UbiB family)